MPILLLLDEPLAALDIRRQAEMRKELGDLIRNFGVPSIVVTHDLRDVVSIGDIVSLMETGKVDPHGPGRGGLQREASRRSSDALIGSGAGRC